MTNTRNTYIRPTFLMLFLCIGLYYGCASPQMVEGGPRDTKPPVVLSMTPNNLVTNFNAKKVVIEFDEFFKLNDQFKEFSVSPDMERLPTLKIKKKTLEIEFLDTLEKNTTYTLNFGKSIADINESNALKNFTYVFSTGPQLDSLSITGKVVNALTGLPELDALAFIIPIERDTIFGKRKPSIYSTTDSSGNFKLSNLRKGTYRVYAIKEQSSDKIYQQLSDEVAFIKDSIVLSQNIDSLKLRIFKENATAFRINDRKLNADGSITMNFNQRLKKPSITILEPSNIDVSKKIKFNKTNDSVKIWLMDLSFDSTKVSISDEGKLLQTVKFTRGKKETYTRNMVPSDNLEGTRLNPNQALKLTFPIPIDSINLAKVTLLEDSIPKTGLRITKDSTDLLSAYIYYPWLAKYNYDIKFGSGAFSGIFSTKNKEFTKIFELANRDDYGTLKAKMVIPEPNKHYILQILDERKNLINSTVIQKDTTITFSNYRAGKYFVRIVYDLNKNGIWDTGNVVNKTQPEPIFNEPKELSIRANWDRNETINIPKEAI